jgi:hypothetical protein
MRASGGLIKKYGAGGVLGKLAHAVAVPFTHFSPKSDLAMLNPAMYGTGMKGAEAARLANAPDIAPRSYIYHGENIVPESGVGGNRYSGVSQNSYPISKDPLDFYSQSKTNDPYLMEMGITQHSPEHTINNMERMIKDAGYSGYHTDTGTGVLFNPTDVQRAGAPKPFENTAQSNIRNLVQGTYPEELSPQDKFTEAVRARLKPQE